MIGRQDKPEPVLMDEEMVKEASVEQLSHDQARRIAKAEGIHFTEILKLRLEYRSILRIDHLWEFTSLAKLELNNNLIGKIEGLDRLVNLTWLNLSFNSIEKIEGLGSLRKLELLNLTNNQISVIENMDALEKLTHFCFANNRLGELDNKTEASIKYHYLLEEMRHKELQAQQAEEAEQSRKAEVKLHMDAFVEHLNGSYLLKSMFKDDPKAETLHCVPGVASLLQTFEQQMVELCVQLFEVGLAEHKRRETEVSAFFSGQTAAVTDCQQKASQILAKFEQQHKERIVELQQLSDPDQLRVKLNHCNDEIKQLCNSLMALEVQLASQLEDIIKRFDINISDIVDSFSETAQGIFAQCRDLEDNYHERMQEIALATLESVSKDGPEEDMTDDVKMLFTDRNTVMDAVAVGHDNHLLVINDRESQLITGVDAWKVALIKGIQDKELKRNRMCVSDIHRYVDHLREQLDELL
ncbi:dynein regulatory complex subunit 3 isoform X2 [Acanthopagrus latus]|uniref:dynein regulatory complex subunit 3 isoform X2 n=1 Tax=Acanthopagrus latus TaxID=8177 RepID=UPI00187C955E|nr:dynein regulatory complex subunit 3 isoform X2 [Acanthopagrus latus]